MGPDTLTTVVSVPYLERPRSPRTGEHGTELGEHVRDTRVDERMRTGCERIHRYLYSCHTR